MQGLHIDVSQTPACLPGSWQSFVTGGKWGIEERRDRVMASEKHRIDLPTGRVYNYTREGGVGNRGTLSAKDVLRRLHADGWVVKRRGPGDHVQLFHPSKSGRVTLDM